MKTFNNIKIWITVALVIVLAGAIFIAALGFNQTPDYKAAYEVTVSVDQNVKGSGELVKTTADKYFNEKGYKYSSYATQVTEDGALFIYKFNDKGNIDENELKEALSTAFEADAEIKELGLKTDAAYKQTATTSDVNVGLTVLACALGLLAAFIIALFIVKLASATTVVINAVLTALVYISIIAIARIPASTDLVLCGALSMIIASIMTFVIACRYKEIAKANDKDDIKAVAALGVKESACRLGFIACLAVVAAVAFSATGSVYMLFTGLKILVATVSAYMVTVVATPVLFSALKSINAKK